MKYSEKGGKKGSGASCLKPCSRSQPGPGAHSGADGLLVQDDIRSLPRWGKVGETVLRDGHDRRWILFVVRFLDKGVRKKLLMNYFVIVKSIADTLTACPLRGRQRQSTQRLL